MIWEFFICQYFPLFLWEQNKLYENLLHHWSINRFQYFHDFRLVWTFKIERFFMVFQHEFNENHFV